MHNLQKPIVGTLVQGWTQNPCLAAGHVCCVHSTERSSNSKAVTMTKPPHIDHIIQPLCYCGAIAVVKLQANILDSANCETILSGISWPKTYYRARLS